MVGLEFNSMVNNSFAGFVTLAPNNAVQYYAMAFLYLFF